MRRVLDERLLGGVLAGEQRLERFAHAVRAEGARLVRLDLPLEHCTCELQTLPKSLITSNVTSSNFKFGLCL